MELKKKKLARYISSSKKKVIEVVQMQCIDTHGVFAQRSDILLSNLSFINSRPNWGHHAWFGEVEIEIEIYVWQLL